MARLFIVGNGYDISRRGDTRYSDFKQWLLQYVKKHPECGLSYNQGVLQFTNPINEIPSSSSIIFENTGFGDKEEQQEGKRIIDSALVKRKGLSIKILFEAMHLLKDENWSSFEENLAFLPMETIIKNYKSANRLNGKTLLSKHGCSHIDKVTDLLDSVSPEIRLLFAEWVGSFTDKEILQKGFEKALIKRIEQDDTFIIFNYTEIIEKVFNNYDPNIFYHIHGEYKTPCSIIIGHNNRFLESPRLCTKEDYIKEFFAELHKNPKVIINRNGPLWNRLQMYDSVEIYEFGWSCSDVDRDYIVKIVELLGDRIKHLYLNDFCNGGERKKQQWIKSGLSSHLISFYDEEDNLIIYK